MPPSSDMSALRRTLCRRFVRDAANGGSLEERSGARVECRNKVGGLRAGVDGTVSVWGGAVARRYAAWG
ncbi:hypothetical protein [Streptomyces sp. NBC_00306]|uniref:hypothetical protein n=1 Tax=Streptomyces sp. NBC_00306 TaxID=2975708 RepID=UPI002E2932C5|nr:hypothetical protein [Streptomyces sp. NBC_00306]